MTNTTPPPLTAAERCIAYAACSELVASPHDVDLHALLGARIPDCSAQPRLMALGAIARELLACDPQELRRDYSGLFEVGDEGPPTPIRASLRPGRSAGSLEELVRFYEYFQYAVAAPHAWQPDHLSVQLEFMHWLCYREANVRDAAGTAALRRAQADFVERHLRCWLPALATEVETRDRATPYARVLRTVLQFIESDAASLAGAPG